MLIIKDDFDNIVKITTLEDSFNDFLIKYYTRHFVWPASDIILFNHNPIYRQLIIKHRFGLTRWRKLEDI